MPTGPDRWRGRPRALRSGRARLRPGEPSHDRREGFVLVVAEHDVRDTPLLAALRQEIAALVDRADERDAGLQCDVRFEAEPGRDRLGERTAVVGDGGHEVTDLQLEIVEPVA